MLPANGQMCLMDSEIVFETRSAKNVAISSWRSLYLNNVFVKNAAKLVANPDGSELTANPSGGCAWESTRMACGLHFTRGSISTKLPFIIDGVRSLKDVIEGVENGQSPPADLESRHLWGRISRPGNRRAR